MSSTKILLTGATGYIGGTILHQLVVSTEPSLKDVTISLLLRDGGKDRIAKLETKYGDRVECIPFSGLDDLALLTETASKHDIIINAASGFHAASAEAMIKGLALRKESLAAASQPTDKVWMLHTSGCSNISDKPVTGESHPEREWCDADPDAVFAFEKAEDARSPYPQRTSELRALEAGEALGVPVLSVQSLIIFGPGEGLFQDAGVIVPIMMRYVLDHGHGFVAGDGTGTFDIVHISDVGAVYTLLVCRIIEGRSAALPRGRRGFIFPTNGRERVHDVAMRCLDAAFDVGVLPRDGGPQTKEVRTIDLAEAASLMAGNYTVAEAAWASHLQQKGTVARDLGWVPTFGQEAWDEEFKLELQAALDGKRAMTIANTLNGAKEGGWYLEDRECLL
ncbi:hypothetical protein THARTR1_01963 [Trichoderma harzianum]|uniref:NAD-dependent epimerase/dehydratase domain-containing protein n=1 Tax=Trichoderma harzianum TaxID=5544 RepID=A0A2K0UJ77_TRIHA|nr:hypothetical protein THARTR1_01963 [Trichoderma harzianum]